MNDRHRIAVLISGSGTNLQSFIDHSASGELASEIVLVLSNRDDAHGLVRAERAGIPTSCIPHGDFDSREAFDREIASVLDGVEPDLVVLAGFMRILSPWFVRRFEGRVINIHPALLPKYPGLDTHARALAAGDSHHGSTVHFVTEELDGGPRLLAGRIAVDPAESADALKARVQAVEHRIYPLAAQWIGEGRAAWQDGHVWFDGVRLDEPVVRDY